MRKEKQGILILNGTVFLDGKFEKRDIRVTDGKIAELAAPGTWQEKQSGISEKNGPAKVQLIDATDKYILPGLVDVHTHGRIGEDFSRITKEGLQKLLASYAACGVTAVLGTTMTNAPSLVEASMRILGEYQVGQSMGQEKERKENSMFCARLLGIHMEGPFLGTEKKGAHDAQYLKYPDQTWLEKMQKLSNDGIRLITMDPSLEGAEVLIKKCREKGIRVSLGHTACDYKTAVQAQQAGADHVTHLFNAMNPLHHREPGLIGAALDVGMYTELICDGIHVHPSAIRLMFAAHPEKVLLISDSIAAAGLADGAYSSGGLNIMIEQGKAVLEDGTIAGSTISLFDAMVNAIKFGVPAEAAVSSATCISAESVGLEQTAGSIAEGREADFLVVNSEWKLEQVFVKGASAAE